MGLTSRRKGKVGERALAAEVREAIPELADLVRRGLQSRDGGEVADVEGLPGFWLESKYGKMYSAKVIEKALEQAIGCCTTRHVTGLDPTQQVPVVVVRPPGRPKEPYAVMRWSDLLALIARDFRMKIELERLADQLREDLNR